MKASLSKQIFKLLTNKQKHLDYKRDAISRQLYLHIILHVKIIHRRTFQVSLIKNDFFKSMDKCPNQKFSCFSFTKYCENLLNNVAKPILTLYLDPSGDESVGALLVGGGHGGVQLELLRPAGHAPAAGLGILPARAQWDELCPILVQGGDNVITSITNSSALLRNTSI